MMHDDSPRTSSEAGQPPLVFYTDGACSGNPGPAGLGVVRIDGEVCHELSEFLGHGTNNIAELTAVLRALEAVGETPRQVEIYTDSTYAIGVLTKNWRAKANTELVQSIRQVLATQRRLGPVNFHHVRGHSGDPNNEHADTLAVDAIKRRDSQPWQPCSHFTML